MRRLIRYGKTHDDRLYGYRSLSPKLNTDRDRTLLLKYYTLDRWARDMVRVFQEVLEEN